MNKSITTNSLPPIPEAKVKPSVAVTSNKIQPRRGPDISNEKRRRFAGTVITTRNIEQVQEENRKAAAEAKKGGKKGEK